MVLTNHIYQYYTEGFCVVYTKIPLVFMEPPYIHLRNKTVHAHDVTES